MRFLNPGIGEISDRLTILTLKITAGRDQGKDVAHFEEERKVLLTKIHTRTLNGLWFDTYTELAVVNAFLWQAEDELRALRMTTHVENSAGFNAKAMLTAFRIQALNDHRAELVGQINKDAGEGAGKEKL